MAFSDGALVAPPRRRLEELSDRPRFHPWVRSPKLEACQLYWLPVSKPMSRLHRQWLLRFQELLHARVAKTLQAVPELFVQKSVLKPDYRDEFLKNARRFQPMVGLGRHPGQPVPPLSDEKDGNTIGNQPDWSYWFLGKFPTEQLELFFGSAGTTTIFLEPGGPPPKVAEPRLSAIRNPQLRELVAGADVQGTVQRLQALQLPFLKRSKELFAADLAETPQYPGLMYVLPLLAAEDFFAATPDQLESWFGLFKLYLHESPQDQGVLLASQEDIEGTLDELLEQMESEGLTYPV